MAASSFELDRSTPVVLLWGSIGVMRSLGRLGVPVYCVDRHRTPATTSRYCVEAFEWDLRAENPERSLTFLSSIAQRVGGHPILVAADDHGAAFVAENNDVLRDSYRMIHPSADLIQALSNKQQMFHLCKEHGMPTPDAVFPKGRDDVEAAIPRLAFPVMLKGIDTQLQERRTGVRMVLAENGDELLALYDRLETPEDPNLMLQEYIPGGPDSVWMFNGYFDADSRCLIGFTGRKLRQTPPYTGATSLGVCIRNERFERRVVELLHAVGYRGPVDLGVRFDRRDGSYKLLDVNPRLGATFRLFVGDNGLDVVRALHLDLTGKPVPASGYSEGRKWINEHGDLASSYVYIRNRELSVADWLRSLRRIDEACWFAREDLTPFLRMSAAFAKSVVRRSDGQERAAEARLTDALPARGEASDRPAFARATSASDGDGVAVECVTDPARLPALARAWDELIDDDDPGAVFRSSAWLLPWWHWFSSGKQLRLYVATAGRRLVGVLPAYHAKSRVGGQRLRLMGDGIVTSDYLGVIAQRGELGEVSEAIAAAVFGEERYLLFDGLAGSEPLVTALRRLTHRSGSAHVVRHMACPYLAIPGAADFREWLRNRPMETQLRRQRRWLERQPRFRIDILTTETEIADALPIFWGLHRARWASHGGSKALSAPEVERFHFDSGRELARQGWARLYILYADDAPRAALYGFERGRRLALYQSGRDPGWYQRSVGMVVLAAAVEDAFERGFREVDFLRGPEPYKVLYASSRRSVATVHAATSAHARLLVLAEQGRLTAIDLARDAVSHANRTRLGRAVSSRATAR